MFFYVLLFSRRLHVNLLSFNSRFNRSSIDFAYYFLSLELCSFSVTINFLLLLLIDFFISFVIPFGHYDDKDCEGDDNKSVQAKESGDDNPSDVYLRLGGGLLDVS